MSSIQIAISTDRQGFGYNATLIGSIVRRTSAAVWVKCYCRGFLPRSFETARLKVEFLSPGGPEAKGRFPTHVSPAVFDRLQVIPDAEEWERCLVMDHDMVALCDLAPYFGEDFGGNLLMGRLFGKNNTLAVQMKQRGGLPERLERCADYPYFFMGPMMNLAAMRREDTWEQLIEAHRLLGEEEQIALTVATEGRIKGVDKKWNLVPQWDHLEKVDLWLGDDSANDRLLDGIRWRNGIPQGIIHWTGTWKPWQPQADIWRKDLWEAEKTSWEHLRMGIWDKPLSIEVSPRDGWPVHAIAQRGWQARIIVPADAAGQVQPPSFYGCPAMPDVSFGTDGKDSRVVDEALSKAQMVRFGSGVDAAGWLAGREAQPDHLVLTGPAEEAAVKRLRRAGYKGEMRIQTGAWPAGGPAPRVLTYHSGLPVRPVVAGEVLYLTRLPCKRWRGELPPRVEEDLPFPAAEERPPEAVLHTDTGLKLHLGCGANRLAGWENLDYPLVDIRKRLPWRDGSVDFLYLEHVIEHVVPKEAYGFMVEAMRILKPGGVLRLAFPDVCRIAEKSTPAYRKFLQKNNWADGSPGSEVAAIVIHHGHLGVWNAETMETVLTSAGYQVQRCKLGHSMYPELRGVESHGSQIGQDFNRIETCCLDAVKPVS